jgi:ribosomal protein S18 acetylase RimI-like enzyme
MPVTDLIIRPAQITDAEALVKLQAEIYDEGRWFVGDGPPAVDTVARRLRSINDTMSLYLVAAAPSLGVLGWLELHRLQPQRLQHVAVLTLAVSAQARRQGLATRLLESSYTWAMHVGVEKVTLNVRAHNTAAINLYEAHGFELEGRERQQIRESASYEDNLLMAKFLR